MDEVTMLLTAIYGIFPSLATYYGTRGKISKRSLDFDKTQYSTLAPSHCNWEERGNFCASSITSSNSQFRGWFLYKPIDYFIVPNLPALESCISILSPSRSLVHSSGSKLLKKYFCKQGSSLRNLWWSLGLS